MLGKPLVCRCTRRWQRTVRLLPAGRVSLPVRGAIDCAVGCSELRTIALAISIQRADRDSDSGTDDDTDHPHTDSDADRRRDSRPYCSSDCGPNTKPNRCADQCAIIDTHDGADNATAYHHQHTFPLADSGTDCAAKLLPDTHSIAPPYGPADAKPNEPTIAHPIAHPDTTADTRPDRTADTRADTTADTRPDRRANAFTLGSGDGDAAHHTFVRPVHTVNCPPSQHRNMGTDGDTAAHCSSYGGTDEAGHSVPGGLLVAWIL